MNRHPLLKKSQTFFLSPLEEEPETEKIPEAPIKRTNSAEISPTPEEPPSPTKKRLRRALTVKSVAHETHQTFLKKKVGWAFVFVLVLVLERLFIANLRPDENSLIISLQSAFGITYDSYKWYIQPFLFMENGFNFHLIMTHFFLIAYYYISPIIGLKIMHLMLNFSVFVSILEIIYGAPRPFWDNAQITGSECASSFGFPSLNLFGTLFLFLYSKYTIMEVDDETRKWSPKKIGLYAVVIVFVFLLCINKVMSGLAYLSQTIFTLIYAVIAYSIATFYNKGITSIVEKSSIDIQAAKRYSIFWFLYLMIAGAFSIFFYEGSNPHINITWMSNYVQCLATYNETDQIPARAPYHLMGAWASFVKTVEIAMLIGAIFGSAKTFRDFKGSLWYAVETKKHVYMTIIANLCLVPSWVFVILQSTVIQPFMDQGINLYIINVLHFLILYYFLYGVLPKYIFERIGLVKSSSESFYRSTTKSFGSVL